MGEKNIPGYSKKAAPAILLPSNAGMTHTIITGKQRRRYNANGKSFEYGTIKEMFKFSYNDLISSGVDKKVAQKAIKKAYKYFDSIKAF